MMTKIFGERLWRLVLFIGLIIPASCLLAWFAGWRPNTDIAQLIAFAGCYLAIWGGREIAWTTNVDRKPAGMWLNLVGFLTLAIVLFGPVALVRWPDPNLAVPTATACNFMAFLYGMIVYMLAIHDPHDDVFAKASRTPN